ncbi:hypothetical protein DXG01_003035 [Tephrocybe rancida]|nr:hypothetical protein DXG01_003035 [Tephrocybe rancida]
MLRESRGFSGLVRTGKLAKPPRLAQIPFSLGALIFNFFDQLPVPPSLFLFPPLSLPSPMTKTNPINAHRLQAQSQLGLDSDITHDDTTGTSAAIVKGLEALMNCVWLGENQNSRIRVLQTQAEDVRRVCEAVACGDLEQRMGSAMPELGITMNGEMRSLVDGTNHMINQLGFFASEIERVFVNTLAESLSTQLRRFTQITAAAMNHDLTLVITVEVSGDMDSLKMHIDQTAYNLKATIEKEYIAREVAEMALGCTHKELSGQIS